ncbi:LexA family protein [Microbacterium amylolyticum]|uniref:DNA polymerase V n=1 Tax=Microbacterium amylolyticum TaxID=936337 RepID=A0ABS4ZKT1_9MICO|nr:translesion error-prone DNA polymerase V autoproteolytic subunit [Microbacterium amylolyticum]MBP2437889.1 DNA polymerase V [Microbacterium amylolyticum]
MGTLNARLLPVAWGEPVTLLVAPESVPAGFPSPSQDYASDELDLNERLIRDRVSTFVWKAAGHSMTEAGLHDGDLLLVDRGVDPVPGHIVVAVVDGEYTVKRLDLVGKRLVLRAEAPGYRDIIPGELSETSIWGVVTWVLHQT